MSSSSLYTLGAMRFKAQSISDMLNDPSITTYEWNSFLTDSCKELEDILIAAYGNDYSVGNPFEITLNVNQFYALPSDFYKLLGVDLQYSASPTGWVSLKRFEFLERNKYAYLQPAVNVYAQTARVWYIPEPTNLIFMPATDTTFNSAVVSMADVSPITVGMTVDGPGIQTNTIVSSVNTITNQVTLSQVVSLTQTSATIFFWDDSVEYDGICGWEQYAVIDAAIKAQVKQEYDTEKLELMKAALLKRIEAMAEGRDAGQAHHVTDAISINSWGYNQLGAASLRYRLLGNQLMLIPIADSDDSFGGGFGSYGGY